MLGIRGGPSKTAAIQGGRETCGILSLSCHNEQIKTYRFELFGNEDLYFIKHTSDFTDATTIARFRTNTALTTTADKSDDQPPQHRQHEAVRHLRFLPHALQQRHGR